MSHDRGQDKMTVESVTRLAAERDNFSVNNSDDDPGASRGLSLFVPVGIKTPSKTINAPCPAKRRFLEHLFEGLDSKRTRNGDSTARSRIQAEIH